MKETENRFFRDPRARRLTCKISSVACRYGVCVSKLHASLPTRYWLAFEAGADGAAQAFYPVQPPFPLQHFRRHSLKREVTGENPGIFA
jgi:hypothetical protein